MGEATQADSRDVELFPEREAAASAGDLVTRARTLQAMLTQASSRGLTSEERDALVALAETLRWVLEKRQQGSSNRFFT